MVEWVFLLMGRGLVDAQCRYNAEWEWTRGKSEKNFYIFLFVFDITYEFIL